MRPSSAPWDLTGQVFILISKANKWLFFIIKSHDNLNLFCRFSLGNLAASTFSQTCLFGRRDMGDLSPIWSHLPHSVPCALDAPSPKALHQLPLAPCLNPGHFHLSLLLQEISKASCPVVGGYTKETQVLLPESQTTSSFCALKYFTI